MDPEGATEQENRCHFDNGVELNGALLNRGTTLAELHELKNKLLSRASRRKKALTKVKARTGGIKQAVVRSIELSDKPLALGEIHRACQSSFGQPVNYNTVKDCVHNALKRQDAAIHEDQSWEIRVLRYSSGRKIRGNGVRVEGALRAEGQKAEVSGEIDRDLRLRTLSTLLYVCLWAREPAPYSLS